jgi:hypothetical protein
MRQRYREKKPFQSSKSAFVAEEFYQSEDAVRVTAHHTL